MAKSEGRRPPEDRATRAGESLRSQTSFRAVFEDHYRDLWRYAGALGVPVSEREDLIQDAFLRVYEHREALVVSNCLTYTYSVLRNAWYTRARRRATRKRGGDGRIDPEADPDEQQSREQTREEDQLARERTVELVKAMGTLPPKMRRCAVLRYAKGFSNLEIAEKLGIAEVTVRTHLHHAAKRLEQILGSDGEP